MDFFIFVGESIDIDWDFDVWGIKEFDVLLGLYFVYDEVEESVKIVKVLDYEVFFFIKVE